MKNLRRIVFGILLGCGALLAADEAADQRLGDVAFYAGDYQNAVSCYLSAMKLADEQKNHDVWAASAVNLATAYLHQGKKELARAVYEDFRKRDPLRSTGTLEGDLMAAEGKYAEAEKFFLNLQTSTPAEDDARLFSLASLYVKTNRLEEAFRTFLIISGKAPDIWFPAEKPAVLTALYTGRSGDAQYLLGKLVARPDSPWREFALNEAVYTLIRLKRFPEALELTRSVTAKNAELELLEFLAEAGSGNIANLKQNFTRFQEKLSPRPHSRMFELLSLAAAVAAKQQDHSFAAVTLEKALLFTADPEIKAALRRQLVGIYAEFDGEAAVKAGKLLIGEFPAAKDRFSVLFAAAAKLYNRKESKAALAIYSCITENASGGERLEAAANAVICAETLPDEEALEKFNRILIMESDFLERLNWQCRYSAYFERHGKKAEAEKELLSALEAAKFSNRKEVIDRINFLLLEFYIRSGNAAGIRSVAEVLQNSADPVHKAVASRELGQLLENALLHGKARNYFLITAKSADPALAAPAAFKAALMAYREGHFGQAADEFFQCAEKFPEYEKTPEALFMAVDLFDPVSEAAKVKRATGLLREKYPVSKAFAVLVLRQAMEVGFSGSMEDMIRDLKLVEQNFPATSYAGEALLLRAYFTGKLGRTQEAMALLAALQKSSSPQLAAESLMRTGEIFFDSGNYAEAKRAFLAAAEKLPGSLIGEVSLLRSADCLLSGKAPLDPQALQETLTILEKLSGQSKFPQVRLEAFYKMAVAMEHLGKTAEAISFYEKAIYTAVDMCKQGITPEEMWCVKSCSSALHLLASSGAAGALQRGMRLIDSCEILMLGDEFITQMRSNFRKQLKKH